MTFSPTKIIDYESFKANQDGELSDLAWLYNMNRGVFMTPGREEEWTLSVPHTFEDFDQFVRVFDEMARDLTLLTDALRSAVAARFDDLCELTARLVRVSAPCSGTRRAPVAIVHERLQRLGFAVGARRDRRRTARSPTRTAATRPCRTPAARNVAGRLAGTGGRAAPCT